MEQAEILRQMKEVRLKIQRVLNEMDDLIVRIEIEVKMDEEDSRWKGPGGRPDGCPASSVKDQGQS